MNISFFNIFLLLVPLFLLILGLRFFRVNLVKKSVTSMGRMIIQLFLVGIYLEYIFKFNNWAVNFIYILLMITVASVSAIDMVKLSYKKLIFPLLGSIFLSWTTVYTLYQVIILPDTNFFESRYIIPVSGMLLGNVLKGQIIFLNNFFTQIKDGEDSYFYLLSMGATKFEALREFYRRSIISSLQPDLANMATIGLVALPGMMTGQILAGASPFTAIKYQISIMLGIFCIRTLSLILTTFVINKIAFDGFSRLKRDIFR
ncbi:MULTISPECIES: ABC transporter permease [Psychrilyobacter]|uniref:ABC transporter permease n=1 Tax=Psychrilyobacter piezotolerans TaxID=2293438 RepID=A0ABX9KGT5_9FUSO|nr:MULTISPECIES: ABC transporter permease [Psychrilyobacter]MCS5420729.1 ABC transporter permease [Psychrilyobacter sp. S5]NDI77995.1 ABC transporter permease [Psychrilyobacter piezotolerans]RDE61938.1 ABC transporter permease [Psychrilyobacter sp. S5]REI41164.1 ABC transporter permease [Psychrilyobacter piezotolerans]